MACDGVTGTPPGYKRHWKVGEPACASCRAAWSSKRQVWARSNPESVRGTKVRRRPAEAERVRRQRRADPARARAERLRYYNAEQTSRRNRRWRANNPEARRVHDHLRRARLASVLTIKFTADELRQRMAYWGDRCWMCRGPFEEADHVIPISKGGPHCLSNLRPACKSCNSRKKDRRVGMFLEVEHGPALAATGTETFGFPPRPVSDIKGEV